MSNLNAVPDRAPVQERVAGRLDFLRALYGEEAPGYLVVWWKTTRLSHWIPADRLHEATRLQDDDEVYFGVALHDQERALTLAATKDPAQTRGRAESTVALPGVWVDIDVQGPAHHRQDLPSTPEAVYELIDAFPLSPTLVVNSGHGLHVYWLFKEPWVFDEESERKEAEALSHRFQATFQELARAKGWTIDETPDLARILRLPGTFNTKLDRRRPVEIVGWHPDCRYDPTEIEPYLVAFSNAPGSSQRSERVDTAAVLAGVPDGQRDIELFRLASKLRRADVPRECAEELVFKAAAACDPPFTEKEALGKVRSAYDRYPPGPDSPQTLATLAALAGEPPRPLHRELPPAGPFPMTALGDILGPAAVAIQAKTQAPDAICAQSVLAAATLGVQGFADVELPTGAVRPLSNFFLSVASTGERKTSADACATAPIRERERRLAEVYAEERKAYEMDLAVWEQQKRQILNNKNTSHQAKRSGLKDLGPRPAEPLAPLLTCPEPTFEGLTKLFACGWPSLGLFSSEGGQFVGGHGMNRDNRLKTAAALSGLWDGESLKRVRAGDPLAVLPGRRLAVHLLVQPGVATEVLSDPLLADQGLLSRLLVAAPEGTVGTRLWREPTREAERNLLRYHDQLSKILSEPLPLAEGTQNELRPRVLRLSSLARDLWIGFADHVEQAMLPRGEYESIRSLANKLPEHAARLAGVVALFQDPQCEELSEDHLGHGIGLAKFYAREALRLLEAGAVRSDLVEARRLLQWLQESWAEELISLPDIYQRGPRAIRDQSRARKMVKLLEDHGWLVQVPEGAEVTGTKRKEVWRVVES